MAMAMDKGMEMLGYSDIVVNTGLPPYTTVNGYAYLRGNFTINWGGLLRSLPALLGGKPLRAAFQRGVPYWRDEVLPAHLETVERWKALDPATAPDERVLAGIRELARSEAAYWGSTTLVLAAAKNSDLLIGRVLSGAMPRSGLSSALFLRGFPSRALEAWAELQDVAEQIRASAELRELVGSTAAQRLLQALKADPGDGGVVLERLQRYFDRYGHQVYNLDFVEPTQAEDPMPVLLSLKNALRQEGAGVRARQAEMARERDDLVTRTARALGPVRRSLFLKTLRWAQGFAPYREDALFYIGSAWPVLRRLALELGRRLVDSGSLTRPDDVFYLETTELVAAAEAHNRGQALPDLAGLACERRVLREARKRLHPPPPVPPAARFTFGPIAGDGHATAAAHHPATGPGPRPRDSTRPRDRPDPSNRGANAWNGDPPHPPSRRRPRTSPATYT
jgi:rifampicin phosphotransferase